MTDQKVVIKLIPNGPARVETDRCEIVKTDGSVIVKESSFSLCRCGASKSKPFCDGSHILTHFKD
jgi:CDGSH-type Zn-finger protein